MRLLPVVLLLGGCATLNAPYWERTWEGAVTHEVHYVDALPWPRVQGVTICDRPARHCVVLVRKDVNRACVLAHEMHHVTGFDHPHYRYNLSC